MSISLTETKPVSSTRPKVSPSKTAPPPRRTGMKLLIFVLAFSVVSALAAVAVSWKGSAASAATLQSAIVSPQTFHVVLKEKGELKAARSTDIKCEVEGRSTIISLIPEGTSVQKGDLLVTLASDEIENKIRETELKEANAYTNFESAKAELDIQRDRNASDIRKAQLQIELKTLELQKYKEGDWAQKLKDAEVAIEQAKITLDRRKQDFEASKQLFDKNYTTKTEFDEADFNHKKAEWDLEKAKMALEVLKKYTHEADLKIKESDLDEAEKEYDRVEKNAKAEETKKLRNVEGREKELVLIQDQLAKFRAQKEKCRIFAPTQGFVVYYQGGGGRWGMGSDTQMKEGAAVIERQILMQLPDTSEMMVVVRVHEAKTDKLRLDQPVTVTIEGIPGRVFTGRVRKIAALADSQSGWLNPDLKEYETEILLDPTDVALKPGVTAQAEIMVTTVENELAIPVQAIYAKSGRRFVFRQKGDKAEAVPVQVGPVGTEWAAITSGLNSGDRVLMAFTDDHRRMIQDIPGLSEERQPAGAEGPRRRGPGSPGGGGRPGGGRPGGSSSQQTMGDAAKPAEVAVKPGEDKTSVDSPAKQSEPVKPVAAEKDSSSGRSP